MPQDKLNNIINICVIPDCSDDTTTQFQIASIALSRHLNAQSSGIYCLSGLPRFAGESLPHCTISHAVIPEDANLEIVQDSLKPLIGKSLELRVMGLTTLPALGRWDRSVMASTDPSTKTSIQDDVMWTEIRLTDDLRNLQTNVHSAIANSMGTEAIKTGSGDTSNPHFTLWVNKANPEGTPPAAAWKRLKEQVGIVKVKLAIGSVGQYGQVPKTSLNVKDIPRLSKASTLPTYTPHGLT